MQIQGQIEHDQADSGTVPPVKIGAKATAATATAVTEGDVANLSVDLEGRLRVVTSTTPTGASSTMVQGTAAHDAATVGNPVMVGGKATALSPAVVTEGDAAFRSVDLQGRARVADDVTAPLEGSISVLAITTAASAEQDLGSGLVPSWVTFICSVRFYLTFKDATGVTDPDATATSGAGRTWEIPADQPFNVRVSASSRRFFKARGSASANLRWYVSGV